jgi:hypothetical protein
MTNAGISSIRSSVSWFAAVSAVIAVPRGLDLVDGVDRFGAVTGWTAGSCRRGRP